MSRREEIINYANSFKGEGVENEELKETIRLAIIDGAIWADKTMLKKTCKWLKENVDNYLQYPFAEINIGDLVKDLKKAMEGKK